VSVSEANVEPNNGYSWTVHIQGQVSQKYSYQMRGVIGSSLDSRPTLSKAI